MNITISQLLKLDNVNIIDLRSIEKYNDNHLPGSFNIPKALFIKNPGKYIEKNKKYYLYCQNGVYSYKICEKFNRLGYNLKNILGGYEAWLLEKWD